MSLETLINEAAERSAKGGFQTHTSFSPFIRTLSVKNESSFLVTYVDHVSLPSASAVSVTEKIPTVFTFFADVDFKVDWFVSGELTEKDAFAIMREIVSAFEAVVEVSSDDSPKPLLALRTIYKAHVHFPGLYVDRQQASLLVERTIKLLKSRVVKFKDWTNILDTKPYSTGLRLLGSTKGKMVTNASEKEKHMSVFTSPYHATYQIATIQKDRDEFTRHDITIQDVKSISLRNSGEKIVLKSSPDDPNKKALIPKPGPKKKTSKAHQLIPASDLTQEEVNEVTGYLSALDIPGVDTTCVRLRRYPNTGLLEATLESQTCPFTGTKHKRTSENDKPATYILIGHTTVKLKCFKCEDVQDLPPVSSRLFRSLQTAQESPLAKKALCFQTHESISELIYSVVRDGYAASPCGGSSYKWYYYDKATHRWVHHEKILIEIMSEQGAVQQHLRQFVADEVSRGNASEDSQELEDSLQRLTFMLQTTGYVQAGLLPPLARKLDMRWRTDNNPFESLLDQNPDLMGFNNGVFDFTVGQFRDGRPEDFLSLSTHLNYVPYNIQPVDVRMGLEGFLQQVFVNEHHRNYFLREVSSSLHGTQARQLFFILTGGGANGKSTIVKLMNLSLGDYAGEVAVTLFTQPRPPANCPTPELMQIKGKRIITLSEPDDHTPLILGTVKWVTGGDRITARNMRENNQSFYPQATFWCLTNNIPPINAPRGDFGKWRRVRTISFLSKFVEDPNPLEPLEFKTDPNLREKLDEWKGCFLSLLLRHFCMSPDTSADVPADFKALARQLEDRADVHGRFVRDWVKKSDDEFTGIRKAYRSFTVFAKQMGTKPGSHDVFEKNMVEILGAPVSGSSGDDGRGWYVTVPEEKARFA